MSSTDAAVLAGSGTARRAWTPLVLVVSAAILVRLGAFWAARNTIYPDEIWQVLEPANHMLTGAGILSWEYVIGIRNLLFPGVIAFWLELGRLISDEPALRLLPVRLFMILASLSPVLCAYGWGRNLIDRGAGLIAAWTAALWVDLIYIAPHTLNEVIAGNVMIAAFYLAMPGGQVRPRLGMAGFSLGLAFVLRMHLAPALAIGAAFACGRHLPAWRRLAIGAACPVVAAGLLDWLTLGTPFQSIWLNLDLNVVEGVSREFGVEPASDLLTILTSSWGPGLVPLLLLAALGGRRAPALPVAALAVLGTHLLFAHKEYRFIFPAFPLIAVAAGLGIAGLVDMIRRTEPRLSPDLIGVSAVIAWLTFSQLTASLPIRSLFWSQARAANDAFAELASVPGLCGVGLVDLYWPGTPGASALPDHVALVPSDAGSFERDRPSFNALVADVTSPIADRGFRRLSCHEDDLDMGGDATRVLCTWVRDGGCEARTGSVADTNWPAYFRTPDGRPSRPTIDRWRFRPLIPWTGS